MIFSKEIRDCTVADIVSVCVIENLSFEKPYTPEIFLDLLRRFPEGFRIMENDGQLIAYCVISPFRKYNARESIIINSIAVKPEFRKQGLGSELLRDAIKIARKKGAPSVFLQVAVENHKARNLYTKFGFSSTNKLLKNYYGPARNAIEMELVL